MNELALKVETEGSLGVGADSEAKFPLTTDETMTPQLQSQNKDPIMHLPLCRASNSSSVSFQLEYIFKENTE